MDTICQELGIPRKQIKDTKRLGRFIVIVHKAWLKCLVKENILTKFPAHPGFDEWPSNAESIGQDWTLTYFTVCNAITGAQFDLSIIFVHIFFSFSFFH